MNHLHGMSYVARAARASDVTPTAYAAELVEAFETLAWLARTSSHRERRLRRRRPVDPRSSAARVTLAHYHAAVGAGDDETAAFCVLVLEDLLGPIGAHVAVKHDRILRSVGASL